MKVAVVWCQIRLGLILLGLPEDTVPDQEAWRQLVVAGLHILAIGVQSLLLLGAVQFFGGDEET